DIDLGGDDPLSSFHNDGKGWLPIGTESAPFKGTFDGNGYAIRGLFIDRDDVGAGLFGQVSNAELRNLQLIDVNIRGAGAGALTAYLGNGAIVNVHATGSVVSLGGVNYAGG